MGVEEVDNGGAGARVGIEGEPVVEDHVLEVNVHSEAVLDRPDHDGEGLEVDVEVDQFSPVHHDPAFSLIYRELGSCRINLKW